MILPHRSPSSIPLRPVRTGIVLVVAALLWPMVWGARAEEDPTPIEATDSEALDLHQLPGIYWCEPVQNGYHLGEITVEERDAEGRPSVLRWTNFTGSSWLLFPEPGSLSLRTNEENPYFEDGDRHLEVKRKKQAEGSGPPEILGFRFQGGLYRKQPPENGSSMAFPGGDWSSLLRVGTTSVTGFINAKQGRLYNSISVSPEIIGDLESLSSEEAKFDRLVTTFRRDADAGNEHVGLPLGFLYLYGAGVGRDPQEAEALFRSGNDEVQQEGLGLLARVLADDDDTVQDVPKALEIAEDLRTMGGGRAVHWLFDLGKELAGDREAEHLAGARQVFEWILELRPEHQEAHVRLAKVQMKQRDFLAAWDQATAALELPELTDRNRIQLRIIRMSVAQPSGNVEALEIADFREPFE
ncbi:MAG: hypothetical protein AAGJ31_15660, partial [Verrucomicrobiota bacterium]